jgi:hypothetical protein
VNDTFEGTDANVKGITKGLLREGHEHTDLTANAYQLFGINAVSTHDCVLATFMLEQPVYFVGMISFPAAVDI